MMQTPHKDKLIAAMNNPKCSDKDREVLAETRKAYGFWVPEMDKISSTGKERVVQLTRLLNQYKDHLEVELIIRSDSQFLIRQKGQLKLDNSVIEEFLIHLVDPRVLVGLPDFELCFGPQRAFMSLAFTPASIHDLGKKPRIEIKEKDADFTLGKSIYYKFSSSRYYLLVEYLDMEPEDCRLTAIDNVFLIRHAKRLPFGKRTKYKEVKKQHQDNPIDPEVIWKFISEMQYFVKSIWYDPEKALERGSFI